MSLENTIEQREDRRIDAMLRGDTQDLRQLVDPECRYVHSSGAVDSGTTYLNKLAEGIFAYRAITVHERSVTLVGPTALVVYRMQARLVAAGVEKPADSRCLAVWLTTGEPRLIAFQATPLPPLADV